MSVFEVKANSSFEVIILESHMPFSLSVLNSTRDNKPVQASKELGLDKKHGPFRV